MLYMAKDYWTSCDHPHMYFLLQSQPDLVSCHYDTPHSSLESFLLVFGVWLGRFVFIQPQLC